MGIQPVARQLVLRSPLPRLYITHSLQKLHNNLEQLGLPVTDIFPCAALCHKKVGLSALSMGIVASKHYRMTCVQKPTC